MKRPERARAAPQMGDLWVRVASAAVLAPMALGAVWLGGWAFALLLALAAALILREWNGMARAGRRDAALYAGVAFAVAVVLLAAGGRWEAATAAVLVGLIVTRFAAGEAGRPLVLAFACAAVPAALLAVLRGDPASGFAAVVWLLLLVWASDIGAYFAGRMVGGPKLWPAVSPAKTWAGAAGGVMAAVAVSAGAARVLDTSAGALMLAGGLLSVAAQLGDLGESALKRQHGVKDSGAMIPGHGGLLDRVDGLLAAALAGGALGVARGGFDAPAGGLLIW